MKEAILVDSPDKLLPYKGKLDYMVSTIPDAYDLGAYANMVKPYGHYSQIGMPAVPLSFSETTSFARNRVFPNGTLIGGIPHTQEVIDYCAAHRIYPEIQVIAARELNDVYEKVIHKQARYRYVIDIATV